MTKAAPRNVVISGRKVMIDDALGHLCISHDGALTWDEVMTIKDVAWGVKARAIEVFPARSDMVNSGNHRHIWRLGAFDFCPDLLGADAAADSLQSRHAIAWAEARG